MKKFWFIALTGFILNMVSCSKNDPATEELTEETFYTVSFDADGGTPVPITQKVKEGDKATAPATNPAKDGYLFLYWHTSGATAAYNFQTPITGNMTLTAQYEEESKVEYWQVTWNLNGGAWSAEDNHITHVGKGGTLAEPIAPTKEGSTFEGWYKESVLTNKVTFPYDASTATGDFTLYAKWTTEETTAYWDDTYRQMQLRGRVKTAKAFTEGSSHLYRYLEFDEHGNLLKNGRVFPAGYGDFALPDIGYPYNGYIYYYDEHNRTIKAEDINIHGEVTAVVEYGYGDSHNFYLPTNYLEMMSLNIQNLFLRRGVTSFNLKRNGRTILDAKCTSVSDNSLIFETTVDGVLESLVGDIDRIEVDFKGEYPENLRFMDGEKVNAYSETEIGEEGMPAKLIYETVDNQAMIEYTVIAGFLQFSYAMIDSGEARVQHNDKGYPVFVESYDEGVKVREFSYTYEYDSQGNWTKQVETVNDIEDGTEEITTTTCEYTYWQ